MVQAAFSKQAPPRKEQKARQTKRTGSEWFICLGQWLRDVLELCATTAVDFSDFLFVVEPVG